MTHLSIIPEQPTPTICLPHTVLTKTSSCRTNNVEVVSSVGVPKIHPFVHIVQAINKEAPFVTTTRKKRNHKNMKIHKRGCNMRISNFSFVINFSAWKYKFLKWKSCLGEFIQKFVICYSKCNPYFVIKFKFLNSKTQIAYSNRSNFSLTFITKYGDSTWSNR